MNLPNIVADIRKRSEQFLLTTVDHYVFTGRNTDRGQNENTYASPVTVSARIINRGGADETPVASQFRAVQQTTNTSTIRMQLPYDLEVSIDDYFVINATSYDVVHVPEKHELSGSFVIYLQKRT